MKKTSPRTVVNSSHQPVVSVVIPCYNYARFLPDAVNSALGQEGVAVRVLIVDDASTDESPAVAKRFASQDPRVSVLLHKQNMGHIATYNEGLAKADGDYVVLLSADDMLAPGSLQRSTSLMEAHGDVGLVYGYAMDFSTAPEQAANHSTPRVSWSVWSSRDWIKRVCQRGRNIIVNPEAILRRSLMDELGGYRPDMPHAADMDLWLRAAARAKVGRINGPVQAYYRIHGSNMHITGYGNTLADISARRHVFESLAAEGSKLLDSPRRLLRTARRALAHEAVRASVLALDANTEESLRESRNLAIFAKDTDPQIEHSRLWRSYERRQMSVASPLNRRVAALADRWRWSIQWRRWRRYGI